MSVDTPPSIPNPPTFDEDSTPSGNLKKFQALKEPNIPK